VIPRNLFAGNFQPSAITVGATAVPSPLLIHVNTELLDSRQAFHLLALYWRFREFLKIL
jgi:hypothetical protein